MYRLTDMAGSCISDRLFLARTIALIELLRKVDESVPLDAICVYLDEVDKSGLRSILLNGVQCKNISPDAVDTYRSYGDLPGWRQTGDGAQFVMPPAIVKMTKDYIARVWWSHVKQLASSHWPDRISRDRRYGLSSDTLIRVYPQYVINALNAFNPIGSTLAEMESEITSLLAALRSDTPSEERDFVPRTVVTRDHVNRYTQVQTQTPLTNRHINKLNSLQYAIMEATEFEHDKYVIPNKVEKDTLLNAIEVMALLLPPEGMTVQKALRTRILYEYDRLGTTAYQLNTLQNAGKIYDSVEHEQFRDKADGVVNAVAELCGKFSPAAAIIFGKYYSYRYYKGESGYVANFICHTIFDSSLSSIIVDKSRITPEVSLFFIKEAELFTLRLRGAFGFFKRKDDLTHTNADPGEVVCEDTPCACCGFEGFHPCVIGKYSAGLD